MFNVCKCNLFHFLYANEVSLLLVKMMRVSMNQKAALTRAVNNHTVTERKECLKNSDKFMFRVLAAKPDSKHQTSTENLKTFNVFSTQSDELKPYMHTDLCFLCTIIIIDKIVKTCHISHKYSYLFFFSHLKN